MAALILLFFSLMALADPAPAPIPRVEGIPQKLVLRVEQDSVQGGFQQALILESGKVTAVRNSNFLCQGTDEVALGKFQAVQPDAFKADRDLTGQLALRILRLKPGWEPPQGEHGIRTFLGDREVTGFGAGYEGYLRKTVETKACDLGSSKRWKALSAVSVTRPDPKTGQAALKGLVAGAGGSPAATVCLLEGGRWVCRVPGWGTAFFDLRR